MLVSDEPDLHPHATIVELAQMFAERWRGRAADHEQMMLRDPQPDLVRRHTFAAAHCRSMAAVWDARAAYEAQAATSTPPR